MFNLDSNDGLLTSLAVRQKRRLSPLNRLVGIFDASSGTPTIAS
nr:MAG TPA: hypothetical protein [Caudoviricetes sp.]